MRPVLTRVLTSVLVAVLATGLLAPTATGYPSGGEIRVPSPAYEDAYGAFTGVVRVRCDPGLEATGLLLSVSQAGVTSSEQEQPTLPSCDGEWERLAYLTDGGFDPGHATVHVRLLLADADSGADAGEVEVSERIWVRAAAKVRIPRTAKLRPSGLLRARVWIRCDQPWENYASFVSARQGAVSAEPRVVEDVVCDGTYQRRTAWLQPDGGDFRLGRARVMADITLTNTDGDDGPGTWATRRVRVR